MTAGTKNESSKSAEQAMAWYGWGSPVGLAVFLVALSILLVATGVLLLLLRFTIFGR